MECDRVEYSVIRVALRNDSAEGLVGGVRFEYSGERGIEMEKDRGSSEGCLQLFKCRFGSQ